MAVVLLNSISDRYRDIKVALEYGRDELTTDLIINALRNKALEIKFETKNNYSGDTLLAKGKGFSKPSYQSKNLNENKNKWNENAKSKNKAKGKKCFYCGKLGHFIKDCYKKKNKLKEKKVEGGNAALVFNKDKTEDGLVLVNVAKKLNNEWIRDSGCSFHMCPNKNSFLDFKKATGGQVIMGNNMIYKISGIGTIKLLSENGKTLNLKGTRYILDLERNLVSLGMLDDMEFDIKMGQGHMKILRGNDLVISAPKRHGLYFLEAKPLLGLTAATLTDNFTFAKLWLERLGHIDKKSLKALQNKGILGNQNLDEIGICEKCVIGKQVKLPFLPQIHNSKQILEYLHADLWGPASVTALSSFKYYLLVIDDYSRKIWIFLLKSKDETFSIFKEWKIQIENQTDNKIKILRIDNRLEFCNYELNNFCKECSIVRHRTVTYTPQQNGIAERMNRTLLNKVRCMLLSFGLPKLFWGEAVKTAAYLVNRTPTSALNYDIPESVWSRNLVDYSYLKFFGCAAYAHQNIGKLERRSL